MRRILSAMILVVGLVSNVEVWAQVPPEAPAPSSIPLVDFGIVPRPAFQQNLIRMPGIQDELRMTKAQKDQVEATGIRQTEKIQKLRGEIADRQKFLEAREIIFRESKTELQRFLEPRQFDRLDQVQLQAKGPLAFQTFMFPQIALDGPDLAERLKLSDDQLTRVQAIALTGIEEIEKAATVQFFLDTKAGAPNLAAIRILVEGPEFQAAKQNARENARKAWVAVIERIEQVLTEPQRTAYHEMLGPPFDFSNVRFPGDVAARDADLLAVVLNVNAGGGPQNDGGGGGGGQQADPTFDTKIARPSYKTEHPRVLFDEAHFNFHTSVGRYKPFAEVIGNDGYKIIPNREKFTRDRLAKADILIIANALGADGMGQPKAAASAFTEPECDAVRDWVQAGGSLLLITDHAPFGSAAESLAKRFGVDMSKGSTADPVNSEGGETFLIFTTKNELLGDHPITKGRDDSERINRIQTFTGQSVKGPAGSTAILKLADTAVDQDDDGKSVSAAGRAQGVAFAHGKGRVVVLGEAAELSAQMAGTERFGMNVPGLDNRQMALNIMHWLSGLLEPRGRRE